MCDKATAGQIWDIFLDILFDTFDFEEYRDLEIYVRRSLILRIYARSVHVHLLKSADPELSFCR